MNRGIEPSVIRVQFGVDCGDHAETRRTAVEATRDTTVGELLDAHAKPRWSAWDLDDELRPANENIMLEIRPIIINVKEESNG